MPPRIVSLNQCHVGSRNNVIRIAVLGPKGFLSKKLTNIRERHHLAVIGQQEMQRAVRDQASSGGHCGHMRTPPRAEAEHTTFIRTGFRHRFAQGVQPGTGGSPLPRRQPAHDLESHHAARAVPTEEERRVLLCVRLAPRDILAHMASHRVLPLRHDPPAIRDFPLTIFLQSEWHCICSDLTAMGRKLPV